MALDTLLKELRQIRRLTRAELSDITGIKEGSLARYERAKKDGGQVPPLPNLAKLCVALQVGPIDIFAAAAETEEDRDFFEGNYDDFWRINNREMAYLSDQWDIERFGVPLRELGNGPTTSSELDRSDIQNSINEPEAVGAAPAKTSRDDGG